MSRELYSERTGNPRTLDQSDFSVLIWRSIKAMREDGYFTQAVGGVIGDVRVAGTLDESDFIRSLKQTGMFNDIAKAATGSAPFSWRIYPEVLFDTLEYLYAEGVARIDKAGISSKADGQRDFRDTINPDLGLVSPPMEMLPSGQIVERPPDELRALLDDPIPDDVPLPLRDPLQGAIDQYRRRGATEHDKRSALKHLADVLEPLRKDIDEYILPADEQALFHLANRFYIRHNDRTQLRTYDGDIWLDWMFYVYVATARALLSAIDRERLRESVLGEEPDDNGGIPF